jgi:hypothetical protein
VGRSLAAKSDAYSSVLGTHQPWEYAGGTSAQPFKRKDYTNFLKEWIQHLA